MQDFNFEDLKNVYHEIEEEKGEEAYKHMSELLQRTEELHREHHIERKTGKDIGQSWRSFKGKSFQKLIQYIITEAIEKLGLKVVNDDKLENRHLPQPLDTVKRNLTIDYGEFGLLLPDADEESDKVKLFEHFIPDLKQVIGDNH